MKCILSSAVAFCFLLTGFAAYSASPKGQHVVSPGVAKRLSEAENRLSVMERIVQRTEGTNLIAPEYSETLENEMVSLARTMVAAFDEALKETKVWGESKGTRGTYKNMEQFEVRAKQFERRTKMFADRIRNIEGKLEDGRINVDRSVLGKMSPREKRDFMNSLRPVGRDKIKRENPHLFGAEYDRAVEKAGEAGPAEGGVSYWSRFLSYFSETILGTVVPDAEAANAAIVYFSCGAVPVVGCVATIGGCSVAVYRELDNFDKCYASASGWWKRAKQAACVAALAAWIA